MKELVITPGITTRDPQFSKYLTEIGRIPLLSAEEEAELACRSRHGDSRATDQLVMANLRFVVSVAKKYQGRGLDLPDLNSAGYTGLMRAARTFDETRGFKFISYAVWWIRQAIYQALAETGHVVRLPQNKITEMTKIFQAICDFEQKHHRKPSTEEIAKALKLDVDKINDTLGSIIHEQSSDALLSDDDDNTLLDRIRSEEPATDQPIIDEGLKQDISRFLEILDEREADIVTYSFGINCESPMSLDQIAEMFNLTRERVRQLREKALRKLRNSPHNKLLVSYLG